MSNEDLEKRDSIDFVTTKGDNTSGTKVEGFDEYKNIVDAITNHNYDLQVQGLVANVGGTGLEDNTKLGSRKEVMVNKMKLLDGAGEGKEDKVRSLPATSQHLYDGNEVRGTNGNEIKTNEISNDQSNITNHTSPINITHRLSPFKCSPPYHWEDNPDRQVAKKRMRDSGEDQNQFCSPTRKPRSTVDHDPVGVEALGSQPWRIDHVKPCYQVRQVRQIRSKHAIGALPPIPGQSPILRTFPEVRRTDARPKPSPRSMFHQLDIPEGMNRITSYFKYIPRNESMRDDSADLVVQHDPEDESKTVELDEASDDKAAFEHEEPEDKPHYLGEAIKKVFNVDLIVETLVDDKPEEDSEDDIQDDQQALTMTVKNKSQSGRLGDEPDEPEQHKKELDMKRVKNMKMKKRLTQRLSQYRSRKQLELKADVSERALRVPMNPVVRAAQPPDTLVPATFQDSIPRGKTQTKMSVFLEGRPANRGPRS